MGEHVLVPFDGSEYAERGFEWAIERYPDATVTVLSVVDPLSKAGPGLSDAPLDVGDAQEAIEMDGCVHADTDVQTVAVAGTPAATIVEYADTREFDAIVMGTHGRSGVIRLLFGSVAETVARHAPAPVTLVK